VYGLATSPFGGAGEIAPGPGIGSILMENALDKVPKPLFTVTVKLNVPSAVGVPEIMPVVSSQFNPGGRLPAVMSHSNTRGLPVVAMLCGPYTVPTDPEGSGDVVVIVGVPGGVTVILIVLGEVTPAVFVAVTEKLNSRGKGRIAGEGGLS
jgi:hypothetical protein